MKTTPSQVILFPLILFLLRQSLIIDIYPYDRSYDQDWCRRDVVKCSIVHDYHCLSLNDYTAQNMTHWSVLSYRAKIAVVSSVILNLIHEYALVLSGGHYLNLTIDNWVIDYRLKCTHPGIYGLRSVFSESCLQYQNVTNIKYPCG